MKANFKILALGGLDENGKNAYILETEKDMILIEAGKINYDNKSLGIGAVVPDFSYVVEKKDKLRGIFISHGHFDQMGGLENILVDVQVPIYGSVYTNEFLKQVLNKKYHNLLTNLNYSEELKIGEEMKLNVFSLSHAIYGNYGFCISKGNDAIIYATDYNFDQVENKTARTDIKKIVNLATKFNIVALLTESISVENTGMAASDQNFNLVFQRFVESSKGRIITSLYSSNLAGMRNIMKIAQTFNRKIVIIGRDLLNYVNIARNLGYISHQRELFIRIPDMSKYSDDQLMIVVSGLYAEPFTELGKMSTNQHNIIQLKDTDSVLIATKPNDETEGEAQRILDLISRTHCRIAQFNINVPSHAYKEDIKMLINLLEPKMIIPIKGEYRKLKAVSELSQSIGYDESDIHLLENGDIFEIYDDYGLKTDSIYLADKLVSLTKNETVNPIILKDREVLADNGYVMIVMVFYKKSNELCQEVEIISGGLSQFSEENLIEGCRKIVKKEIEKKASNKELVNKIKNKIARYLQTQIGKTPMILPVRMEIDLKRVEEKKVNE